MKYAHCAACCNYIRVTETGLFVFCGRQLLLFFLNQPNKDIRTSCNFSSEIETVFPVELPKMLLLGDGVKFKTLEGFN